MPITVRTIELAALFAGQAIAFAVALWRTQPTHPAVPRLRALAVVTSLLAIGFSVLG